MEASQRREEEVGAADATPPAPTLTVAAVARRLGVAPPTLRTWDRRYGLGPSAHTAGAHRRYSPADVARLMVMRRLTLEGVSPADAAKIAVATPVSPDGRPMHTPAEGVSFDAVRFDLVTPQFEDDDDDDDEAPTDGEGFGAPALNDSGDDLRPARPQPPTATPDRPDDPDRVELDLDDVLGLEPFAAGPSNPGDSGPEDGEPGASSLVRRASDVARTEWSEPDPGNPDPRNSDPRTTEPGLSWTGVLRSVGSERGTPGGGRVVAMPDGTPQTRGLARAAMSLDTYETHRILRDAIGRDGVVITWDTLILPVVRALGERTRVTGEGIEVEHAFSEVVLGVLRAITFGLQRPRSPATVLLACAESDYHSVPLHALAAALAERDIPSRMLGSGLPANALISAVRRTGPSVVVLFARMAGADGGETEELRRQRPTPVVVLAGPGWQPDTIPSSARTAGSLVEAVDEVLLALHT